MPAPAQAATVSSVADLQSALSPGTDETLTLIADSYDLSADVVVNRDVTIDLGGYVLMPNSLTVTPGNTLTLIAGTGLHADFLQVEGTLELAENLTLRPYAKLTVGSAGSLITDGGAWTLGGTRNLVNNGVIKAEIAPDVVEYMTGNNYMVRFINNSPAGGFLDVRVLAPTFDAVGIAFPVPTREHAAIAEWSTNPLGGGMALTPASFLSDFPSKILVYAQWWADGITSFDLSYEGAPGTAYAGDIALTATDTTPGGSGGDITDMVTFTSDNPTDSIDVWALNSFLYAERAGTRTVSGVVRGDLTMQGAVDVTVGHARGVDDIELAMTPAAVTVGESSQAYLSATDAYGNSFGVNLIGSDVCDDCDPVLASSEAGDVIDQATGVITFATTGVRMISATVQAVESDPMVATATVEVTAIPATPLVPATPVDPVDPVRPVNPPVTPAPAGSTTLATTGSEATPVYAATLLLILGASGVILAARRRARR